MCPGFSFVAFKLFSKAPVFEKEQTDNSTCYRYLLRNLFSCRNGSEFITFKVSRCVGQTNYTRSSD